MDHLVIGVSGRRGAGKDTAFGYLNEWLAERGVSSGRRGFADSLKHSFARLFIPDISVEEAVIWCDELKLAGMDPDFDSKLTVHWVRKDQYGTYTQITHQIDGRQALQRYGTEAHRDIFGDDFWVDALLPTSVILDDDIPVGPMYPYNFMGTMQQEPPTVCVVPDLRFENEAQRIKLLKGLNLFIDRPGGTADSHVSERGLPNELIDWTVHNDGNLDDLRLGIRQFCNKMLAHRLDVEPDDAH